MGGPHSDDRRRGIAAAVVGAWRRALTAEVAAEDGGAGGVERGGGAGQGRVNGSLGYPTLLTAKVAAEGAGPGVPLAALSAGRRRAPVVVGRSPEDGGYGDGR
jgi:hypothetical protein